ncbi:MAG: DUF169 domain-containing protein [Thermoleophilia bacterium]|nr:DUF169 domain-containing protein [Thermoleophilia bacterium]
MGELTKLERDLSVFEKLGLEKPPVGVKFLFEKPEGIPRLDKKLGLCEMLIEAQKGNVFYADLANHECAGPVPLGMVEMDPFYEAGQIGPCLEVFKEGRANRRIYEVLPKLARGSCNYLAFAPLDELTFDPDVLVLSGTVRQMEIVLRSFSYTTGATYESRSTPVLGCAWTFVYPYISGKINFGVTGLTFGHIAREVGTEGEVNVSIPWNSLVTVIENLESMKWVLPSYTEGRDNYNERFKRVTGQV